MQTGVICVRASRLRCDAGPITAAIPNSGIRFAAREVRQPARRVQHQLDVGIGSGEAAQARDEPQRSEGGLDTDDELLSASASTAGCAVGGVRQDVEAARYFFGVAFAALGQLDAAPGAHEQLDAEPRLEIADVAADGGMRHVQLRRGQREAHVAGGGFERFQRVERGQACATYLM